jgi:hypothetical protein
VTVGAAPDSGRRATKLSSNASASRTANRCCVATSASVLPTRSPEERTSTAPRAETSSTRASATKVTSTDPACGSGTATVFGPIFGSTATA